MEFKGTKGNWSVMKFNGYYNVVSDIRGGEVLAKFKADTDNKELEPNSLLISKAPEMLEMLKKLRAAILSENYIRMLASSQEAFDLIKQATEIE